MTFFFSFHLVSVSPWPLLMSLCMLFYMMSMLLMFNEFDFNMMIINMILMSLILFQWWRDIVRESTYQGFHNIKVINGLRLGMLMFILSELMFFVSFFWSFFHLILSPSIEMDNYWSMKMVVLFNPYNIPLLNTMILLSSGVSITLCHHSLLMNKDITSVLSLMMTLFLGIIFSMFQFIEYKESFFSFNDSMYGSIFFLATGFHGFHVLVGSTFILITLYRLINNQFSMYHHFGFEACSWYWHFVDVVWLFLYIFVYWLVY